MANPADTKRSKLTTFLRKLFIPTTYECLRDDKEQTNDHMIQIRNVMLVAVALITAVTFQAGISPPGGVWQDTKKDSEDRHEAGQAIYSSRRVPFLFFLICNTLAFSSSIYLLLYLTFGYPFFLEVLVATFSMSGTYAAAIFAITPYENANFRLIALVAALPIIIRPVICLLSRMIEHERTNNV
jgi:hypothetical protein